MSPSPHFHIVEYRIKHYWIPSRPIEKTKQTNTFACIYEPGPRTPTPPPPMVSPPTPNPPTPPKPSICMLFAHIHTHIHIYTPLSTPPTSHLYVICSTWEPRPPPPPPQNLVFARYLHIYIHIYTYILPFPPLQPRISTLFAALESHDLVNGPCLPVYFYHNLFFEPPIACLAHGLQHICYLWITQSLPMQT